MQKASEIGPFCNLLLPKRLPESRNLLPFLPMAVRVTDFLRIFTDVMTNERIIQIDSVDAYNKLYGWETLHPLVTVVNHANPMASDLNHSRLNYGLYALFLKQGDGCSIRYGREKYDYQEGTELDFPNLSFFGKFVKEHLGMSPTEYRQQNLNNGC